jgi:hypothetical protein
VLILHRRPIPCSSSLLLEDCLDPILIIFFWLTALLLGPFTTGRVCDPELPNYYIQYVRGGRLHVCCTVVLLYMSKAKMFYT